VTKGRDHKPLIRGGKFLKGKDIPSRNGEDDPKGQQRTLTCEFHPLLTEPAEGGFRGGGKGGKQKGHRVEIGSGA